MTKNSVKVNVTAIILSLVFAVMAIAICEPAIGLNPEFCWLMVLCSGAGCLIALLLSSIIESFDEELVTWAWVLPALFLFGGSFLPWFSSPMFHASGYSRTGAPEVVEVEAMNLPTTDDSLCLMDSATAKNLARRKAGEDATIVSQFEISGVDTQNGKAAGTGDVYTQVINGRIVKVVPLKYAGFFQCMKNDSVPAFVVVDVATNEAELRYVDGGIVYAPFDIFSQDLERHVRRNGYRTTLFGDIYFNISDDYVPYWTITVEEYQYISGCAVPVGVLLVNATTGEIEEYGLDNAPAWIDCVVKGNTAEELYNRYGRYNNGFVNFSHVNMSATTDDFGYIVIDNDIYYYTGVTSVSADESNIGLLLVNSRTLESKYCNLGGAEEYSAMGAAEGVVANYGYHASFPTLITVDGEPAYAMVLKDENGIVKSYGIVNYKNYTVVTVADSLLKAKAQYQALMAKNGNVEVLEDDLTSARIVITDIEFISIGGDTVVYVKASDGKVFKSAFEEKFILLNEGDEVTVSFYGDGEISELIGLER